MIQVKHTHIPGDIARIESRYNGDNDLIPGAPVVTWSDYELLHLVKTLFRMVEDLQGQIDALDNRAEHDYRNRFGG